ncbi:MAG: beta-glucosidase [Bacteroidales bacterium]|nr:beta-glucosidase [Bacteroidales bacterium]
MATQCGERRQPTVYIDGVPQLNPDNIDEIIPAMTLDEKVSLLIGTGMAGFSGDDPVIGETRDLVPGAAGTTWPIPRLGIPAIVLADGPAGLRIAPQRPGDTATYYCTAFPIATQLASSWDLDLVREVGVHMGAEVLEYGVDVLLGPGMNLHRNPLCGRNFEYYSEDPFLTGKMAAAMVTGVQSNGVGTSVKHFAANSQETNRMANDARMSVRALRELYLKGFEIAVKEAQPRTIMTSYNKINGTYTSESRDLLTTVTRSEWGFEGTIMTDWFGGKDAAAQVYAGNDLLMPGRPDQKEAIMKALQEGTLEEKYVDENVKRVLELIVNSPRFKGYAYSNKPDLQTNALVTRRAGAEGMVLLKNDSGTLPLTDSIKNIAAFGNTSYAFISGGTGSGDVNEAYTVSLVQGLTNAGYVLDESLKSAYEAYRKTELEKQAKAYEGQQWFMPKAPIGEYLPPDKNIAVPADKNELAIITIGRNSGEFTDRKLADDFLLSQTEKQLIEEVCEAFHARGKKVVLIINAGGVIETASWKSLPDAILLAWQGGQEGGNAVADILSGKVNPSGKLTMTFPVGWEDHPSSAEFPAGADMDIMALLAAMTGGDEQKDKDPVRSVDYTDYMEDIFVGYRAFEHNGTAVSYPFGYGLSYTAFEYGIPAVLAKKDVFTITMEVKNTGETAGREVVQVYVGAPAKDMIKPVKELRAFGKTKLLEPGESETLSFTFTARDLASFDAVRSGWVTESGSYNIYLGASSADIRRETSATVKKEIFVAVNNVLTPQI